MQPENKTELAEDQRNKPNIPIETATYRMKKLKQRRKTHWRYGAEDVIDPIKAAVKRDQTSSSVQSFLRPRETMSKAESGRRQKLREEERQHREENFA